MYRKKYLLNENHSKCHKNMIKTILRHQTEIGAIKINNLQYKVISKMIVYNILNENINT